MRVLAIIVIVILVLLSGALGWQIYTMRQSVSGQTNAVAQRDAELARLCQTLAEKDAEIAQLLEGTRRGNKIYLDVSKTRTWTIRTEQALSIGAIRVSVQPRVDKIFLGIAASVRFPLLSGPV